MQNIFIKLKIKINLLEFLEKPKKKIKNNNLGAGSNILFRDKGVKGSCYKLGNEFSYTNLIEKNIIVAGAATLDRKVANFAKENSLENLEFLSCIPGSIGGAVIMNSGCYEMIFLKSYFLFNAIDKKKLQKLKLKKKILNFCIGELIYLMI